jgi:hypothetical protein
MMHCDLFIKASARFTWGEAHEIQEASRMHVIFPVFQSLDKTEKSPQQQRQLEDRFYREAPCHTLTTAVNRTWKKLRRVCIDGWRRR